MRYAMIMMLALGLGCGGTEAAPVDDGGVTGDATDISAACLYPNKICGEGGQLYLCTARKQ